MGKFFINVQQMQSVISLRLPEPHTYQFLNLEPLHPKDKPIPQFGIR